MALTHDGIQTPLPPSRAQQALGVAITAAGLYGFVVGWYCTACIGVIVGALVVANQLGGVTRVRVTFSKLLVEDERPVMGFLIGPAKRRIPWEEYVGVEVGGGRVLAKGKSGDLVLGEGCPESELQDLARRIGDAAQRFQAEKGA